MTRKREYKRRFTKSVFKGLERAMRRCELREIFWVAGRKRKARPASSPLGAALDLIAENSAT